MSGATVRGTSVTGSVRAHGTLGAVRVAGLSISENSDYEKLRNKPHIEGVELVGDRSFADLGLGEITPQDIDNILYGG